MYMERIRISEAPLFLFFAHLIFPAKVEFDNDFLYITRKKVEEKVPLASVIMTSFSLIHINNFPVYKVKYSDNSLIKTIRFFARYKFPDIIGAHGIVEFEKKVKEKNPKADIRSGIITTI